MLFQKLRRATLIVVMILCALTGILIANTAQAEASDLNTNDTTNAYVSAMKVKTITDGTAPWDADNTDGNDTDDHNLRVRSFDYVNYTLEYTTALKNEWQNVDSADVNVEFTLPMDPRKGEFNMETMNWCIDPMVTYYYTDGTSSTTWDQNKEVSRQVLTGHRHLENNNEVNAIPGAGTLSVGVYVKASANGDVVIPTFTVWINDTDDKETAKPDVVNVTAEPRYNIRLQRYNSCMNKVGYFDLANGEIYRDDHEGTIYGRHIGYGIDIRLQNVDTSHGMKGMELPTGDITFDFTMDATLDGIPIDYGSEWAPVLWDYRANNSGVSLNKRGELGRNMSPYESNQSVLMWTDPYNNKTSDRTTSVWNGGTFHVEQDADNPWIQHVTISGYDFDWSDFVFPTKDPGDSGNTISYKSNIGIFSVGYIQYVAAFPRDNDATRNLYLTAEVNNISATGMSGNEVTDETTYDDNTIGAQIVLYGPGTIDKYVQISNPVGGRSESYWNAGDVYGPPNSTITASVSLTFTGDDTVTAFNQLMKFDDEAWEPDAGMTADVIAKRSTLYSTGSSIGSVTALFAAKPDKTGWTDYEEQNSTTEEQLLYFDDLNVLKSQGYTCVGILWQARQCKIYGARDSVQAFTVVLKTKPTAENGKVYTITSDMRAWRNTAGNEPRWEDETGSGNGPFGIGDADRDHYDYVDWYPKPSVDLFHMDGDDRTGYGYEPSVYKDGTKTGGHKGGLRYGVSELIVGAKNSITVNVSDESSTGVAKSIYDLDAGERTVKYTLYPQVTAAGASSDVTEVGMTTDVTVIAELPSSLHYVSGTASLSPDSITENDDGTTTIKWVLPNVTVGSDIEPIELSALIGAAGTDHDVQNNEAITLNAKVVSTVDQRATTAANGNLAETTIHVIRLAASSIAKSVDQELTELHQDNTWTLNFGNSSEETLQESRFYDVLPYNGDSRGSDFHGSYVVTSIEIDMTNAPDITSLNDNILSYTTGTTVRTANRNDVLNNNAGINWVNISTSSDVNDKVTTWSDLADTATSPGEIMTGLYFNIGDIPAHNYITVRIHVSHRDDAGVNGQNGPQRAGDIYINNFAQYADNQAAVVVSNSAKYQVVDRALSGTAWNDANNDGIHDSTETPASGTTVTLYRTDRSQYGGNAVSINIGQNNMQLYPAYNVYGEKLTAITTDSDGKYRFDDLESGTYVVVFTDTNKMSTMKISPINVGNDDSKDSDALASVDNNNGIVSNATISDISLPTLEDMTSATYESENNDVGYAPYYGDIVIKKIEQDNDATKQVALPDAGFSLLNASNQYLLFDSNNSHTGTASQQAVTEGNNVTEKSTDGNGIVSFNHLPLGDYTIRETTVPDGYIRADDVALSIAPNASQTQNGDVTYSVKITEDGKTTNANSANPIIIADTPAFTSIAFTKTWNDDNDRDGIRENAVLNIIGTAVGTGKVVYSGKLTISTPSNGNTASASLDNLPAYANGMPVVYSYTEDASDGYTQELGGIKGTWQDGYTASVKNTHKIKMLEYKVKKAWDDDNDRDGLRPDSITVHLNGTDGSDRELTLAASGWSGSFGSLPVYYNHGTLIDYTLNEDVPNGYTISEPVEKKIEANGEQTGWEINISNVHIPETKTIEINKNWDDDNDRDGIRPDSMTISLTGTDGSNREIELNNANGWNASVTVPTHYNHGRDISYECDENQVPNGYVLKSIESTDSGYIITNVHTPKKIDIPVKKIWNDDNDRDGKRTDNIEITLIGTDGSSRKAEISGDNWAYTFTDLPYYFNNGTRIDYSVNETPVDGYTDRIEKSTSNDGVSFTITNEHIPAVKSIAINKTWNDDNNRDGIRPDAVAFTLSGSDGSSRDVSCETSNGYSTIIEDLPVYHDHGTMIDYSVSEEEVTGYQSDIQSNDDDTVFTVTNTHDIARRNIEIIKEWNDDNNRDGVRPENVNMTLNSSDGNIRVITVSASNDWKTVLSDLPSYYEGEIITYELSEDTVEGYELTGINYAISTDNPNEDGCITINNTHEIETMSMEIDKTWINDNESDRPNSITVDIDGNDGTHREINITSENGWTETCDELPVNYDNGEHIEYTVTEHEVDGYENIKISTGIAHNISFDDDSTGKIIKTEITNKLVSNDVADDLITPPSIESNTPAAAVASIMELAQTGDNKPIAIIITCSVIIMSAISALCLKRINISGRKLRK